MSFPFSFNIVCSLSAFCFVSTGSCSPFGFWTNWKTFLDMDHDSSVASTNLFRWLLVVK